MGTDHDQSETAGTLMQQLRRHAAEQPHKQAFQFLKNGTEAGASLSFQQLDQRASCLAQHLLEKVSPGQRVILLYPAGLDFIEGFVACLYAGVIAIPAPTPDAVQFKRAWPRLQAIIDDAEVALILTNSGFEAQLTEHLQKTSLGNSSLLVSDQVSETADCSHSSCTAGSNDLAYLQYTSGSIAAPKGVMISHANLLAQLQDLQAALNYDDTSMSLNWMPHHHDYGLVQGLLLPLYSGASCYVMSPTSFIRKPMRWLQAISSYRVTHSQGSNFAYAYCLQRYDASKTTGLDLSCWKVASNAAEPINPEVMHRFERTLLPFGFSPKALAPAYGLAEATLLVSSQQVGSGVRYGRFAAKALTAQRIVESDNQEQRTIVGCGTTVSDAIELRIVDPETCLPCQSHEIGEVWVAGPGVAQGYWNRPSETQQTFQARLADSDDGPFLRTGDLGFIKDDELFIAGRHKDLLIIRGQNHYPKDIEFAAEASHTKLRAGRCAAFSVEAAVSEQLIVVAEFIGNGDDALYASVAAAINEAVAMAAELTPHAIVLIRSGSLPVTSSGKVQRQACRKLYSEKGLDTLYLQVHDTADDSLQQQAPAHDPAKRQVLLQCLLAAPDQIDEATLRAYLLSVLAEVLRTSGLEQLNNDQDLLALGIDSLASVEIRGYLEDELALSLPINLLFEYPTLNSLGHFVKAQLNAHASQTPPSQKTRDATDMAAQRHYSASDKQRLTDWSVHDNETDIDLNEQSIRASDRLSIPPDKVRMRKQGVRVITDDWRPQAPFIQRDTKVLGMGTCFTRDIMLWLAEFGFNQNFPESPYHAMLRYPAVGNNAYLAEQFQLLRQLSEQPPAESQGATENRRYLDTEQDGGQGLYDLLQQMDVLLLTLGSLETWRDTQNGGVLKAPLVLNEYSPQRHQYQVDSFADTLQHLELINRVTKQHFPQLKIILTLPLGRMVTYRPLSALGAASIQEAVLRAALAEFLEAHKDDVGKRLHYFPAYDLLTQYFENPYQVDNIHASPYVTQQLCNSFADMFCADAPLAPISDTLDGHSEFHKAVLGKPSAAQDVDADTQELRSKITALEAENQALRQTCKERQVVIQELDKAAKERLALIERLDAKKRKRWW